MYIVQVRSYFGSSSFSAFIRSLSLKVMKRGVIQGLCPSRRNLFITPDDYQGRNVFVLPSAMVSFESCYVGQEVWYKDMPSEKIELQGRYTQARLVLTKEDIANEFLLFKRGKVQAICNRQSDMIGGGHLFITPDDYDGRNVFVLPSVMDSFGDTYEGDDVWYQDEPSEKSGLRHRYTQATLVLASDEYLSALGNYVSDEGVAVRIGCDVGNVITIGYTLITDEAIQGVRSMVDTVGPDDFYIVSKARFEQQKSTLALFHRVGFCARTGVLPRNILFCLDRLGTAGRPLRMDDLRAVRGGAINGPRYAPSGYGKGSIATLFELNGLVDDREDCLLEFNECTTHRAPLLLQALFTGRVTPSAHRSIRFCRTWDSVVLSLRHYASLERVAARSRKPTMTSTIPPWRNRQPTMPSTSTSSCPPWKKRRV